ncbi:MAG: 4Fe-4S binding protein [Phycisphaerae bacterium]|nr:4Fe-4S binding protein [Phycisphaerae bacterium]
MAKQLSLDTKWHELTLGVVLPYGGNARVNLTGSWRSERPIWDHERCVRCGVCDMFCPDAAIKPDAEGKYGANLDYCKGCGICTRECPTGSIHMKLEEV